MGATLHTKSAGDAPDDTAKLLRASVEMERMRTLLSTFTEWARLVSERADVRAGIRMAARGLHKDGASLSKAQGGAA